MKKEKKKQQENYFKGKAYPESGNWLINHGFTRQQIEKNRKGISQASQ